MAVELDEGGPLKAVGYPHLMKHVTCLLSVRLYVESVGEIDE